MLGKLRRLNQAGDTIVEVLISIAVVSAVLGGAYVVASTSRHGTEDAQEHTTALKLAAAQLEALNAQPPSSAISGGQFCYMETSSPTAPSSYVPQSVNGPGTNCTVTSQGTLAPAGTEPAYKLRVTYDSVTKIYTAQVSWDSVTGHGVSLVKMFYRTDK